MPARGACEPGAPRTVSVTGGEPLLWPEFVLGLRAMVGPRRVHLETGGAHPRTLARVVDAVDHVSLDLKPDLDLDAVIPEAARLFEDRRQWQWQWGRQYGNDCPDDDEDQQ